MCERLEITQSLGLTGRCVCFFALSRFTYCTDSDKDLPGIQPKSGEGEELYSLSETYKLVDMYVCTSVFLFMTAYMTPVVFTSP